MREIAFDGTFAGWKRAARLALAEHVAPEAARWIDPLEEQSTFAFDAVAEPPADYATDATHPPALVRVPRDFVALAEEAVCFREPTRWALLYRMLWRLTHGEPHLLEIAVDPDVIALRTMAKAVHRDIHKMHAFVRFREIATDEGARFVAWFQPQHRIVEAAAPFFVDRFASLRWSILTPDTCAHWDGSTLTFAPGLDRSEAPQADAMEELWRTYYRSIFNPARVKLATMRAQMPRRYWSNLPEAQAIPDLLAGAAPRAAAMVDASNAQQTAADAFAPALVPPAANLQQLRGAAATCRACPLWRTATCTVFGTGPSHARIVVVGEQPGDQEDRAGQPFIGPAGKLFDRALRTAGIDRGQLYVTNAVKHFKWEPRGKRRLHQTPNTREIAACRPWLAAELESIRPELIVCLGATAAQSVLGEPVRIGEERGRFLPTPFGAPALITVHPASLLRLPPGADPEMALAAFVNDLRRMRTAWRSAPEL